MALKVQQVNPAGSVRTRAFDSARQRTVDNSAQALLPGINSVANAVEQHKIDSDEVAAEEARVQYEKSSMDLLHNPDSGYFNTQGKNAYDGNQPTVEELRKRRESIQANLSPDQARLFSRVADRLDMGWQRDIARHAGRGFKAYEIGVHESSVENALENGVLNWANDEMVNESLAKARIGVADAAKIEGISSEALNERLQNVTSTFFRNVIERSLDKDLDRAEALFERHKDKLEPKDLAQIEKSRETQTNLAMAQKSADEWVDQDLSLSEGLKEARSIEDPKLRKETEHRWKVMRGNMDREQKEKLDNRFNEYASSIENGEVSYSNLPRADLDELTPGQRNSLRSLEENMAKGASSYDAGKAFTVIDRINELVGQGDTEKAREFFKENVHHLNAGDREQYSKLTTKAAKKEATPEDFQAVSFKSLVTKTAKRFEDEPENQAKFFTEVEHWYNNRNKLDGKPPSSQEQRDFMADMVLRRKPWGLGNDYDGYEKTETADSNIINSQVNKYNNARAKLGKPPLTNKEIAELSQKMKDKGFIR